MKRNLFIILSGLIKPICGLFLLAFTTSGWAQSEVAEVLASDGAAVDYFGWACSISGDTAVVGAKFDDHGNNVNAGSAYIYQRDQDCPDCWGEAAILRPDDLGQFDYFGTSVSISGDIAVVGAPLHDAPFGDGGSVYIFYRDENGNDEWGLKTTLGGSDINVQFGFSVFINRDLLIVGEANWAQQQGQARIFGRHEGGTDNWGEIDTIIAPDGETGDIFGYSVAINGSDLAIVGAPFDEILTLSGNKTAGSAHIFRKTISGSPPWEYVQKLTKLSPQTGDVFGTSVSISGETLIVGASGDDIIDANAGAAYIYEQGVSNWDLVKTLAASDAGPSENFGISVSIRGEGAIVGANRRDDTGAGFAFRKNLGGTNNWGQVGDPITAIDAQTDDEFGISVVLDGDRAILGANLHDDNGSDSGSAYVFEGVCPCPWDLDEDNVVSTADLLILFSQWGASGTADFDGSGAVGTSDMLILFANWGVCPCLEGTPPLTLEQEMADACLTTDDWDNYVDVVTDPLSSQADKDRYQCWMEHYVNDCNKCFCVGQSGCPNPDPFN